MCLRIRSSHRLRTLLDYVVSVSGKSHVIVSFWIASRQMILSSITEILDSFATYDIVFDH
jgi:hypothetical protein